jgi:hypothetical protein
MGHRASETASEPGAGTGGGGFALVMALVLFLAMAVPLSLGGYKDAGLRGLLTGIGLSIIFAVQCFVAILWLVRKLHYTLAVGLALIGLVGAGWVLWKAFTFTASGTVSWFRWLLGHW